MSQKNQEAPQDAQAMANEAMGQLDIAKMKRFYKSQIELSKLRTELAEYEARYVKARCEQFHFGAQLAGYEKAHAEAEARQSDLEKITDDKPVEKPVDQIAESEVVNGVLSAGA